ncbi:hypothetical protein W02_33560 [Nitrospira sp. KM1]|nr:hypothetical protein W02_33560 [Nitrospira sp. KM1]
MRLERILSRFASPRSEAAGFESFADPDALAGLDENDPESVSRFMKNMGHEMGDEAASGMDEAGLDPNLDLTDGGDAGVI